MALLLAIASEPIPDEAEHIIPPELQNLSITFPELRVAITPDGHKTDAGSSEDCRAFLVDALRRFGDMI